MPKRPKHLPKILSEESKNTQNFFNTRNMKFCPKPVIGNTNPKLKSICNTSKYPKYLNISSLHKTFYVFRILINPQVRSGLKKGSADPEKYVLYHGSKPNSTYTSVWFFGFGKYLGIRESYIRAYIQNLK